MQAVVRVFAEDQREYVARVAKALRRARLNAYWPPSPELAHHVRAMGPDVHCGLYGALELDARSGLPTFREWTRVRTDAALAAGALGDLGTRDRLVRLVRERGDAIDAKQLLKFDYYSALVGKATAPLDTVNVALRRVEAETRTAFFHVTLDKVEVSGAFVRTTVELSQQAAAWHRPLVTLDAEHAQTTADLQATIFRSSGMDAELTFLQLAAEPTLKVERVIKGTVGPFFHAPEQAPGWLAGLMASEPGAMVASFGLDMVDVELESNRDNDPLRDLLVDSISAEGRVGYDALRAAHGYVVFKDRKFVVPRALVDAMKDACRAVGTRNVVYSL